MISEEFSLILHLIQIAVCIFLPVLAIFVWVIHDKSKKKNPEKNDGGFL